MNEALSVGASLLLPPLPERMEVLYSLLPQAPDSWDSLTIGEVNLVTYTVTPIKSLQCLENLEITHMMCTGLKRSVEIYQILKESLKVRVSVTTMCQICKLHSALSVIVSLV